MSIFSDDSDEEFHPFNANPANEKSGDQSSPQRVILSWASESVAVKCCKLNAYLLTTDWNTRLWTLLSIIFSDQLANPLVEVIIAIC